MTTPEKVALVQKVFRAQIDELNSVMLAAGMGEQFGLVLVFVSPDTGPVPVSSGLNPEGALNVVLGAAKRMQAALATGNIETPPPASDTAS